MYGSTTFPQWNKSVYTILGAVSIFVSMSLVTDRKSYTKLSNFFRDVQCYQTCRYYSCLCFSIVALSLSNSGEKECVTFVPMVIEQKGQTGTPPLEMNQFRGLCKKNLINLLILDHIQNHI